MSKLKATGSIYKIFETEKKSERFRVREFVLEIDDNPQYPQYVKFQLTGDRCEDLDGYKEGEQVTLSFDLRGREWTNREGKVLFFNALQVWEIQSLAKPAAVADDDVPF